MSDHEAIFDPSAALPRGPHRLSREQVASSQRSRLLAAFTELLAERGYAAVTIGELARRAGVSRGAFYEHFEDKHDCLMAAYDRFAEAVTVAIGGQLAADTSWSVFVQGALRGYLGELERDPTAARAFLVEMDGAGPIARRRRREAIHGFAALIADRHAAIRSRDAALAPLPDAVYLALALGVRELVHDALTGELAPDLGALVDPLRVLIMATVAGAGDAATA